MRLLGTICIPTAHCFPNQEKSTQNRASKRHACRLGYPDAAVDELELEQNLYMNQMAIAIWVRWTSSAHGHKNHAARSIGISLEHRQLKTHSCNSSVYMHPKNVLWLMVYQ